jgi:serine/threonine protein kinase/Tol biopolymer transport system component
MTDELIGKKIGGYEITGIVGRGGMATVYRAHQMSMNRVVALKMLPRHFVNDDTYLARFHREVKIVSQLEHRSIVPVYDYGENEGQPYIAMRYMSGGSVEELTEKGPIPLDQIIAILEQIGPALDYAHDKDVLHRDLKPSNILMDDAGGAFVTDFGIARILGETNATITTQGVVGTPSYMSPEQAQGQPLDGRSDLYSLGVMLFEMATGKRPFESDTPYSIAVMQVTTPPPAPRSINPDLPDGVQHVILTALRKRREDRYRTIAGMVEALKKAAANPSAVPLSDTQPGVRRNLPAEDLAPGRITSEAGSTPKTPSRPILPIPPTDSPSVPMVAVPRVRRKGGNNLLASAVIGGLIGCGLLALMVLGAVLLIGNNARQDAQTATAAVQTATARAVSATEPTNPTASEAVAPTDSFGAIVRDAPTETISPDDPNIAPQATFTPITLAPTATPTAKPITGVAPVGQRSKPTPLAGVFKTKGSLVFFARRSGNDDLYRLDLPDLTETRLTTTTSSNINPAVSPDGKRIAFQSNRSGNYDIYVMDADGTNVRRLLETPYDERMPAWSPDGERIVFASDTRGDGRASLYTIKADGTDLQPLVTDHTRSSAPRWSRSGIVYVTGSATDARTWEIRLYSPDTEMTSTLTLNTIKDWGPSFTPDGERILFLTDGNGYAAIATMALKGSDVRILYDGPGYESSAAYSPDDKFIAFTSDADGSDELYLLTADGKNVAQLTTDGGDGAAWFPT